MQKAELVFLPVPADGHLFSALEFAKRLLERDDRLSVTILVMRSLYAPANTGSQTQELAASNPDIRFIDLPQLDQQQLEFAKSGRDFFSLYIEMHKSRVKDAIVDHVLSNSSFLVGLFVDMFCTSMIEVANELGVPSYVFFSSSAAFLGIMLHLPVHYSQTGRGFAISDPNLVIPAFANPVPSSVLPSFLFEMGAYESFMNHALRFRGTRGIFINTLAELEPQAFEFLTSNSEMPPIYSVGPVVNLEGQKKSECDFEKIMNWLDNQPPSSVVFLCFGSAGGFESPQLIEIATSLKQSGYSFLWSIRQPTPKDFKEMPGEYANVCEVLPKGFLESTQNRGLVCGWTPQMEVLAHQAVGGFVSHCGWNSILESIWHGVPIATWPLYSEQQTNAFLLVKELELGVELVLDYSLVYLDKLVMADEIEKAIRSLMDAENPVRERVKEMSEISRKALVESGSSFVSMGRLIEDVLVENM